MNEEIISQIKENMGTHWDENGGTTEYAIEKAIQLQKSQDLKLFEDFVEKLKSRGRTEYEEFEYEDEDHTHKDSIEVFKIEQYLLQTLSQEVLSDFNQQDCKGGQTISDNVGSSRNSINGKVLATSESRAKDLLATSERSDEKSVSNMETTGDVRLKPAEDVSLLNGGTPRSSKSPADNYQETELEDKVSTMEYEDNLAHEKSNLSPDNSQNLNKEEQK